MSQARNRHLELSACQQNKHGPTTMLCAQQVSRLSVSAGEAEVKAGGKSAAAVVDTEEVKQRRSELAWAQEELREQREFGCYAVDVTGLGSRPVFSSMMVSSTGYWMRDLSWRRNF